MWKLSECPEMQERARSGEYRCHGIAVQRFIKKRNETFGKLRTAGEPFRIIEERKPGKTCGKHLEVKIER